MTTDVHQRPAIKKETDSPVLLPGPDEATCRENLSEGGRPETRFEGTPHSEAGLRVSEEEYWETYYTHPDFRYEWNNGMLEENR